MMGLRLLSLLVCAGFASTSFGLVVMTTSDTHDSPYAWSESQCKAGESDLVLSAESPEARAGKIKLVFRNIIKDLGLLKTDEPMHMTFASTRELIASFTDREETTWIFNPKRNRATCDLTLQKDAKGILSLWGSCHKLTPKDPEESFSVGVRISDKNPLTCDLGKK